MNKLQELNNSYFDFIKHYLNKPSNVLWLHGKGNEGRDQDAAHGVDFVRHEESGVRKRRVAPVRS